MLVRVGIRIPVGKEDVRDIVLLRGAGSVGTMVEVRVLLVEVVQLVGSAVAAWFIDGVNEIGVAIDVPDFTE